ncbi:MULTISPECIES: hypothetical protein [Pseudomonas]|uniref:hypothetical protein n=1 Tax=Pseudomonas TaxID=286 RepID=UPI0021091D3F|nr:MULTISPECIES: hypothetical protein [Pseudomonas]WSO27162.1 hypothetical protein VUJ50_14325 [Pseudomonas fluorescens]
MSLHGKTPWQWLLLALINLGCLGALFYSPVPFNSNSNFHTLSRQWLEDQSQLNTEEFLTVSEHRMTHSTIESLNGQLRNATLTADIIHASPNAVEVKVVRAKLSQDSELFAIDKTPDLFFRRQYVVQEGSTLNYSFLATPSDNTLCFFQHEMDRLRCMNH